MSITFQKMEDQLISSLSTSSLNWTTSTILTLLVFLSSQLKVMLKSPSTIQKSLHFLLFSSSSLPSFSLSSLLPRQYTPVKAHLQFDSLLLNKQDIVASHLITSKHLTLPSVHMRMIPPAVPFAGIQCQPTSFNLHIL